MGMYSPVVADEQRIYLVGSTRVVGLQPQNAPQQRDKKKNKKQRSAGSGGS